MASENYNFFKKLLLPLLFLISIISFFANFIAIDNKKSIILIDGITLLIGNNFPINIKPNIWFILAFITAVICFLLCVFTTRLRNGIGFLLALAGLVFLLMGQFNMVTTLQENEIKISFQLAYWVCLTAFALAGSNAYLKQNKSLKQHNVRDTKSAVNINIITQSSDSKEKY